MDPRPWFTNSNDWNEDRQANVTHSCRNISIWKLLFSVVDYYQEIRIEWRILFWRRRKFQTKKFNRANRWNMLLSIYGGLIASGKPSKNQLQWKQLPGFAIVDQNRKVQVNSFIRNRKNMLNTLYWRTESFYMIWSRKFYRIKSNYSVKMRSYMIFDLFILSICHYLYIFLLFQSWTKKWKEDFFNQAMRKLLQLEE